MSSSSVDPKDKRRDIDILREWLRQQPHLPDDWDEEALYHFFKYCDFSLELCKMRLDSYFAMRTNIPEFFTGRDVNIMQPLTRFGHVFYMPKLLMPGSCKVGIVHSNGLNDYDQNLLVTAARSIFMMADIRLMTDGDMVEGDHYVINAAETDYAFGLKLLPLHMDLIRRTALSFQDSYPFRIKGIHLVNVPPIFHTIFMMCKPFVREKIRNRIFVHSNFESLSQHVPQDMLPDELGGTAGSMEELSVSWYNTVLSHEEWVKKQEMIKSDESKRPAKMRRSDMFGTAGSFKQLDLD